MIERLGPPPRRLDEHAQVIARRRLADEFGQRLGTQRCVLIFRDAVGGEEAVCGHGSGVIVLGTLRAWCRMRTISTSPSTLWK